jgi:hypothetical protein
LVADATPTRSTVPAPWAGPVRVEPAGWLSVLFDILNSGKLVCLTSSGEAGSWNAQQSVPPSEFLTHGPTLKGGVPIPFSLYDIPAVCAHALLRAVS